MAVDVLSLFFLRKLEAGFAAKKEVLSERDQTLLLTVVERIDEFPIGIEDAIPNHSAFSRARNERFRESHALAPSL